MVIVVEGSERERRGTANILQCACDVDWAPPILVCEVQVGVRVLNESLEALDPLKLCTDEGGRAASAGLDEVDICLLYTSPSPRD